MWLKSCLIAVCFCAGQAYADARWIPEAKYGGGLQLDGWFSLRPDKLGESGEFTFTMWVRPDRFENEYTSLIHSDDWQTKVLHIMLDREGVLEFFLKGNSPDSFRTSIKIETGRWAHLAFAYSMSARNCGIYVDGELKEVLKFKNAIAPDLDDFNIGGWAEDDRGLVGALDDVRYYNSTLVAVDIALILQGKQTEKKPTAWWELDETGGDVAADASGNRKNARLWSRPVFEPVYRQPPAPENNSWQDKGIQTA